MEQTIEYLIMHEVHELLYKINRLCYRITAS